MTNWQESFKIFKLKAVTEVTTRPSTSEHIIREDQASVIIGEILKGKAIPICDFIFILSLWFSFLILFMYEVLWKIGKRVCMNFVFSTKFKLWSINRKINSIHRVLAIIPTPIPWPKPTPHPMPASMFFAPSFLNYKHIKKDSKLNRNTKLPITSIDIST